MKNFVLIIIIFILSNLISYNTCFSAQKDLSTLVPLERQLLINWVNENCHENHENWQSLIDDGRLNCKKGINTPVAFWSLKGYYQKPHISGGKLLGLSKKQFAFILKLIIAGIFLFVVLKKTNGWKKLIISILFILGFLGSDFLVGFNYFAEKLPKSINSIHDAAHEDNIEKVKYFIETENVNPNSRNKKGKTALDIASMREFHDIAYYLAQYAPEINAKYTHPNTPIATAASTGNIDLVSHVIERDGVAYSSKFGEPDLPPLHRAACANNLDIVKILVLNGASPSYEAFFKTALDYAIWCNNKKSIDYFLNINSNFKNNPLETAVRAGKIDLFDYFKSKGFISNNLFELATKYNRYNIMEHLDKMNEFNNLSDKQISRAVAEVERLSALNGALFLAQKNIHVELSMVDEDGCNLVIAAVKLKNPKLIKLALSKGLSPREKDEFGYDAIDYAKSIKDENIQKLFDNL